jgi:predicted nucleic acid-binding protein
MIAVDTSSLVSFLKGETGDDVERIGAALSLGDLAVPPVVVTEILSDAFAAAAVGPYLTDVVTLEVRDGYWIRAGEMRRILRGAGFKARVADALIAQSCIDHSLALITRDRDFRHFAKHCGLRLA